jgi:hypothetical protein
MKYWYNLLPLSASKTKSEEISLFGNLWLRVAAFPQSYHGLFKLGKKYGHKSFTFKINDGRHHFFS